MGQWACSSFAATRQLSALGSRMTAGPFHPRAKAMRRRSRPWLVCIAVLVVGPLSMACGGLSGSTPTIKTRAFGAGHAVRAGGLVFKVPHGFTGEWSGVVADVSDQNGWRQRVLFTGRSSDQQQICVWAFSPRSGDLLLRGVMRWRPAAISHDRVVQVRWMPAGESAAGSKVALVTRLPGQETVVILRFGIDARNRTEALLAARHIWNLLSVEGAEWPGPLD